MRLVLTSVLAATLVLGGVAAAQVSGVNRTTTRSAYMVEPFTPAAPITINGTGVRLRAEPFATNDTPVLSTGSTGLQLTVVGLARQADWNWYQVILRNGQKAFIRSDLTSAPMRGDATSTYVPPVQPVAPPPQIVYTPPPQPQPVQPQPTWTPPQAPVAQPLPPIPTQPVQGGGAISLTPRDGSALPLNLPSPGVDPAPAPVDNGLLSISPSAPVPRLSNSAETSGGTVSQTIRAQLDAKRCWTDSSNMMDAERLRASFGVTFSQNGRFASEPRLISPASDPSGDPAMMVFLAKARAAMRTCNALGFDVPSDYFSGGQGEVRLDFSAR
jgi:hypothetical protein